MVAPSGEGAVRCMNMALSTTKNKIDYINKTNELSICYSLSENVWNSKVTNQLILHDIK